MCAEYFDEIHFLSGHSRRVLLEIDHFWSTLVLQGWSYPKDHIFGGIWNFHKVGGDLQLVNFELQRIFEKCGPIHQVVFWLFSATAMIGLCISVYFSTDCLSDGNVWWPSVRTYKRKKRTYVCLIVNLELLLVFELGSLSSGIISIYQSPVWDSWPQNVF